MTPPPAPGDEPAPGHEKATRVWAALQDYVLAQDHREKLREVLGLGRGTGRVKALLRLTEGPLSLRGIAEVTGVDAPYATLIVDHLEARGLVERAPHPDDRRRKIVTLTAHGREAAALAEQIINQPPPGFAQLPDAELTGLENVLDRLRQASD